MAAREQFYCGPIAKQIVKFASQNAVSRRIWRTTHMSPQCYDFSDYETRIENPVSAEFRGMRIHKCGPWSQGPVFLQQLRLLEGYDLRRMGHNSANYIHLITEASKLAFADREEFYGDPLFTRVPMELLLSRAYAKKRRKLINMKRASLEMTPGTTTNSHSRPRRTFGEIRLILMLPMLTVTWCQ